MSDILQYISLGVAGAGLIYSGLLHVFHRSSNKTNDINSTIKFQNIDSNINNIKELFQKIIKSNLFSEVKNDVKDLENQVKEKVENIVNFGYDKIKEVVSNEKKIDDNTAVKVSNMLQLSQNIQQHIDTQQAQSDNQQQRKTLTTKQSGNDRVSVYQLPVTKN